MPKSAEHMDLPFDAAIDYFREKVNLPTRTWKDLWQGMHARAFTVAGAMKDELLTDLNTAIDKGISQGTTLNEFRRDFDGIVEQHGWKYKGGKGWRTAVMFNTNLSTAYSAGHYKQMMDPDVLRTRPFLRYVASSSADPRPEHMAWYNLILPADHPFWKTHTPPNGWGCKCGVVSVSAAEAERLSAEEMDGPYPVQVQAPPENYYRWTDKATGKVHHVPEGIDPGWDYNVGETAWGQQIADDVMSAWKAKGAETWERLTPGSFEAIGRADRIPADPPRAKTGPKLSTVKAAESAIRKLLGGDSKIYSFQSGSFSYSLNVDAKALARHMDLNRTHMLPYLPETMEDPYEIWLAFERHKGTGKVELRQRVIKAVRIDKHQTMIAVFQAIRGTMESWTIVPTTDLKYANRQRVGKLIWARD